MAKDSCENPVYLVPQVRQVIESAKPPMPKLTLTRAERSAFRFSANPAAQEAVEISTKSVPGNKLVSVTTATPPSVEKKSNLFAFAAAGASAGALVGSVPGAIVGGAGGLLLALITSAKKEAGLGYSYTIPADYVTKQDPVVGTHWTNVNPEPPTDYVSLPGTVPSRQPNMMSSTAKVGIAAGVGVVGLIAFSMMKKPKGQLAGMSKRRRRSRR